MVGYCWIFIRNYTELSAILSLATSSMVPQIVQWNPKAFTSLYGALSSHAKLTVPSVSDIFTVHTDASCLGVGAVLNMLRNGE